MSCLSEEFKLPLKVYFGALIIVNSLNALYALIMVLFNQVFRTYIADVVKQRIANTPDILTEVLPQAVDQPLNIVFLSKFSHVLKPGFDSLEVIQIGFFLFSPLVLAFEFI